VYIRLWPVLCTYISRVGQNHIYTVCIRYFWQENHRIYDHIRCIYTVLANPIYKYTLYGLVVGMYVQTACDQPRMVDRMKSFMWPGENDRRVKMTVQ